MSPCMTALCVLVGWEGGTGSYWESTCQGWEPGPVGPSWDSIAACTHPGGHRLGLRGHASGPGSTALHACRHRQGLVSHYRWLVRCCLRPSPNHWGPRMGRHCRWELELDCETEWHSNSMKMFSSVQNKNLKNSIIYFFWSDYDKFDDRKESFHTWYMYLVLLH